LETVIINTAGGIAGGDHFNFDIDVGEGAELTATTAAAEKVYRAIDVPARIDVRLTVASAGKLIWLPQETILFQEARLRRTVEIDLAAEASLLFVEAVVFGRTAMGEMVTDGELFDRWRVRRSGELIFADAVRLDGAIGATLARTAVAAGRCAVATVLAVLVDADALDRARGLSFGGEAGISAWNGLMLARLVAPDGAGLRRDLQTLLAALHGSPPRLWMN
jgi:urease accessory protein